MEEVKILQKVKLQKTDLALNLFHLCLLAAGLIFCLMDITHETLWYDESYTGVLVRQPIWDIARISGGDNHPPLYYLLLKLIVSVFGNSELTLRAFSAIGAVSLAFLGMGPVKRIFDTKTGIIYSILIPATPIIHYMGQEARMYTWAAFFVTGSALYGYLAAKDGTPCEWIKFAIFSIAAAYTHYYALLAAAIINVFVFGLIIFKERHRLKGYLITAGIQILCYLPWVAFLTKRIQNVSKDYWIEPLTNEGIWKILLYPVWNNPKSIDVFSMASSSDSSIRAVFFGALSLIVYGLFHAFRKSPSKAPMLLLAFAAYALTISTGVSASYLVRPVFIDRYTIPVLGLFLLAIAYGISQMKIKAASLVLVIVIVALSIPQYKTIHTERLKGPMKETHLYMKYNLEKDDVFLHTSEHTLGTFSYYFPENRHILYLRSGFKGYSNYEAFAPNGSTCSDLSDFFSKNKEVWLVDQRNSPESGEINYWLASGRLRAESVMENYRLRRSWFGFSICKVAPETLSP